MRRPLRWKRASDMVQVVALAAVAAATVVSTAISVQSSAQGQSTWNGVAILAQGVEPVVTWRGLPGDPSDIRGDGDDAVGADDLAVRPSISLPEAGHSHRLPVAAPQDGMEGGFGCADGCRQNHPVAGEGMPPPRPSDAGVRTVWHSGCRHRSPPDSLRAVGRQFAQGRSRFAHEARMPAAAHRTNQTVRSGSSTLTGDRDCSSDR